MLSPEVQPFPSLNEALKSLGQTDTVIVTRETGLAALKVEEIAGLHKVVLAPPGEPKLSDLLNFNIRDLYGVKRIVSIGAGSVIDYSKGLLLLAEFPEFRSKLISLARPSYSVGLSSSTIELVAIPTRAGSGSEVSSSAIFKSATEKVPVFGPALVPQRILWVPSLLSDAAFANLGGILDMLAHAVESMMSAKADHSLDLAALDVIRTILDINPKLELNYWDKLRLLKASLNAGLCQDSRLVSLPHALAHTYSNDLPHGLLVGNFLAQFLVGLKHADPNTYRYLDELFENHAMSLHGLLEVIQEMVGKLNTILSVASFEKITFDEASVAMKDPSARLTRVSLQQDSFAHYDFKLPLKSGQNV